MRELDLLVHILHAEARRASAEQGSLLVHSVKAMADCGTNQRPVDTLQLMSGVLEGIRKMHGLLGGLIHHF